MIEAGIDIEKYCTKRKLNSLQDVRQQVFEETCNSIKRIIEQKVKAWAHKLNCVLVPVSDTEGKEHQLSVLESLLGMNVGAGQANKQVLSALEDGVVTPAEMDETDRILEEIEHKIQSLRKAMKGECAKYLSALQIEKA